MKNRVKRGALLEKPNRLEQLAWHAPSSAKTKKKRAIYVKINARLLHMQEQGLRTEATPVKLSQRNSQKKPGHTKPPASAANASTKRTVTIKPIVISSDETELESRENSSDAMSDSSEEMEIKTVIGPNPGDVLDHEIKTEAAPKDWSDLRTAPKLNMVCSAEAHEEILLEEVAPNPESVFKRLGGKAAERTWRFKFGMSRAEAAQKTHTTDLSNIKCNLETLTDPRQADRAPRTEKNPHPSTKQPSVQKSAFDFSEPPTVEKIAIRAPAPDTPEKHTKPLTLTPTPPQPESDTPTEAPEDTSLPDQMLTDSDDDIGAASSPPRPTADDTPKKAPALKIRKAIRKPLSKTRQILAIVEKTARQITLHTPDTGVAHTKPTTVTKAVEAVHNEDDEDDALMDELDAYLGNTEKTDGEPGTDDEYNELVESWVEAKSVQEANSKQ